MNNPNPFPAIGTKVRLGDTDNIDLKKSFGDREGDVVDGPALCVPVYFPPREGAQRGRTVFMPVDLVRVVPDPKAIELADLREQMAALAARIEALASS